MRLLCELSRRACTATARCTLQPPSLLQICLAQIAIDSMSEQDTELMAIGPVDGRYKRQVVELSKYTSEFALIKYRLMVEVEYFIALSDLELCSAMKVVQGNKVKASLRDIYISFSLNDAKLVKKIETVTNHDVKAVEYYLKQTIDATEVLGNGWSHMKEYIHFALTSQDINNTAIPLMLRDALDNVYNPVCDELIDIMAAMSAKWFDVPMLARTHGQPGTPTSMGKEIRVFVERVRRQMQQLRELRFLVKFGGATGGFNAHNIAYPNIDWPKFADEFIDEAFQMQREQFTTQISSYDNLAEVFHVMMRINTILIDFSRDMWQYVSMNYFKLKVVKNEVGSSAMPHKVNPIDFENAEGNLGIANALFDHFCAKLPISRLQRDLSDSTVLRNVGVPLGHSIIALRSLLKGCGKVELNKAVVEKDLNAHWEVVAEAVQTILRREGVENPYEKLKEATRGQYITAEVMETFIEGLAVDDNVKRELLRVKPNTFLGVYPTS